MTHFFHLILRTFAKVIFVSIGACLFGLGLGGILPPAPRIVYMAEARDTTTWDLFMLELRTGANIRLTQTPRINERYPAWSSDGRYIAYHANSPYSDQYDIHIMDASVPAHITAPFINNSNVGVFTLAYDKAMPAWSPDDMLLGFHAKTDNGRYGLFIGHVDGSQMWMVINPSAQSDVIHFAWSPDGSQISYITTGNNISGIYRLQLPNTIRSAQANRANQELIIDTGSFPAWSPDGRRLVYVQQTADGNRLFLYDFATQQRTQLTQGRKSYVYDDTHPDWSPDGEYIIFASSRRLQAYHLYIIKADGSGLRQLITAGINAQAPDWTN